MKPVIQVYPYGAGMSTRLFLLPVAGAAMAILAWVAPATAQVGEPPAAEGRPKSFSPRLLHRVEPEYTQQALDAGISGTVAVSLVIRADGTVNDLKVARGLGYGLDEKAIECVEQWEFKPGTKDGVPVDVHATAEVNFKRP